MARAYKDGAGASYDGTTNQFVTVPFGSVMVDATNPGAGQQANPTGKFFEIFSFGADSGAGQLVYKQKVDNSNAGNLRDCAECHVGGGMNEYAYANMSTATYKPHERESLRTFDFGTAVTAWNYFIDIFNPDLSKRGDVVKQDYSQTGVLEMDCLMCHQTGYDWAARKEAVRMGEFDASRAVGAKLTNSVASGTTVFYNYTAVKTNASGKLYVDLSSTLNSKPVSTNCSACHQSQYNVDWKKRGEQWLAGQEVHYGLGCMACHERKDAANPQVGVSGLISDTKLGLCDPAKGGASDFDAMWNKLDTVNFKQCSDCHEPTTTPVWSTYGAPNSAYAHAAKGLTAKIAYDKNGAPASHMDIMDCTACHIYKNFDGGAMVDGTGADAEGRVALHDEQQVAREMNGTAGNALYWNNGKLYGANLLTSSFVRDMNGMDTVNGGIDANNDGRNAGMDTLLQTHINDLNNAVGAKAVTMEQNADGSWVNEAEMTSLFGRISGDGTGNTGLKQLLGVTDDTNTKKLIPKMSFLMVPFKASHNIASTSTHAWGKNGCADCHGADKGFYNGAYPIRGNMDGLDTGGLNKFRFMSNQVTTFTKVNGLADVTDSHPSVVTKKGDRTVPVPMLTKFDGPYVANASAVTNQTLRNIDRSEVIYEQTFQARDTAWYTSIIGSAPAAVCSGPTSPFFCATPTGIVAQDEVKSKATSTKGWLLKVEVRPAGDTNVNNITFRSAQLSKDNATSMAEVLAALPASFTTNGDFTVTEAGGALTITAAAGKEIRVSPQTDSGPLGLKGKVYKADPIVRNGVTVATTRDAYVSYLNNVSVNLAEYGIGVDPVAAINPIADASAITLGVQVKLNDDVVITAPLAQPNAGNSADAGSVSYTWSTNATDAVITNPTSRTAATIKFTTTGTKTIKLTVTDEEGKASTATTEVTAIVAPIVIAWDAALDTATFSNYPAGTASVKVIWGDGLSTIKTGASVTDPLTIKHTYATATSKTIKLYCYNALGAQVGYQQKTITP